jgi:hypothetical protein
LQQDDFNDVDVDEEEEDMECRDSRKCGAVKL